MTGTAKTEEAEFKEIYGMDVVEIPTNEPVIRIDYPDVVYKMEEGKFNEVVKEIKERHKTGQPILVGTINIEKSELLSKRLKREGIPHQVLNAKYHEKEADIVAQAGRMGAVTIATNMAGRGTDIVLGGNPEYLSKAALKRKGYDDEIIAFVDSSLEIDNEEIIEARKVYEKLYKKFEKETEKEHEEVINAGGLHIIGTERHESRRIDNQLRGRAGRQGDPGSSRFYISFEDDLIRIFGGQRTVEMVNKLGMPDDQPLEHKLLTRTIENAQRKVEGNNFAIRKHVLQYDDVMNKQREVIYGERKKVLEGENLKENIISMIKNIILNTIETYTQGSIYPEEWNLEGIKNHLEAIFLPKGFFEDLDILKLDKETLKEKLFRIALDKYEEKEREIGEERFREIERVVLLQVVDRKWMDHIDAMDQLRQGIGLRAYGQEDPVRAYQVEGFDMFEEMNVSIQEDTVKLLFNVESPDKMERKRMAKPISTNIQKGKGKQKQKPIVKGRKIGRNEPCPCGSGKKYKKCCGR